jgi:hypothetical protein
MLVPGADACVSDPLSGAKTPFTGAEDQSYAHCYAMTPILNRPAEHDLCACPT